jgi:hypothetical protein
MTLVQQYTERTVTFTIVWKKIRAKVPHCFMIITKGGAQETTVRLVVPCAIMTDHKRTKALSE